MQKENLEDTLAPFVNFFFEVGVLNRTPRTGFRHLGGWQQSISEHLLRTTYIGFALAHLEQERGEEVDITQVLENCLFHDLGEARALDLDYISQKYSSSDELKAVSDAVKDLPFGERIIAAFNDFEERKTIEGIIAKDADQLELLCSLKEIIDNGNLLAQEWVPNVRQRIKTVSGKNLAEALFQGSSNDWWYKNKKDQYWVKGGKRKE